MALLAGCDLELGKVTDAVAGARLAEVAARCVLSRALAQDADPDGAEWERHAALRILADLAVPAGAPVRSLVPPR
jgi:hypothetical protein